MGDRIVRSTSVVFIVAVLVHGADHVRRRIDAVTKRVLVEGAVQFVFGGGRRLSRVPASPPGARSCNRGGVRECSRLRPRAPRAALRALSDAFTRSQTGPGSQHSRGSRPFFEIGADIAFAWAGVVVLRRRGIATPPLGHT